MNPIAAVHSLTKIDVLCGFQDEPGFKFWLD
jgi:hypothetical protein